MGAARGGSMVVALLLAACGSDGATAPEGPDPVLQVVSGDQQRDTIGATLPQPLRVRVVDDAGAPVAGTAVRFTVEEGDVTLSAATSTTGAAGEAETGATLGTHAGPAVVAAALEGGAASGAAFELTVLSGAPSSLETLEAPPPEWFVENRIPGRISARVTDRASNPVTAGTVAAQWSVLQAGGEVAGAPSPVEPGVHEAFWTLGPHEGPQTLRLDIGAVHVDFTVEAVKGGRIAFSSDREVDDNQWDLFSMKPDGSDVIRLTASDNRDKDAEWSPDHERVLFNRIRPGETDAGLWTVGADGEGEGRIGPGGGASWSPDGATVAYFTKGGADGCELSVHEVWLMPAAGGEPRRIIEDPCGGSAAWPEWSPDGSRIVYQSRAESTDRTIWHIWTATPDGGNRRRVTEEAGNQPQWSPDGATLVFGSFVWDPDGAALWSVSPDGGPARVVWAPDDEHLEYVMPGGFSPNGAFVVVEVGWDLPGIAADVFIVHLESGEAWDVTGRKEDFDGWPSW